MKKKLLAGLTALLCCLQSGMALTAFAEESLDIMPSPGTLPEMGDVDLNGNVNILDVVMVNRAVLGRETLTAEQNQAADVNHDGTVDSTDSLGILKYIVGLMSSLEEKQLITTAKNLSESVRSNSVTGAEADEAFISGQTAFYLSLFQDVQKEAQEGQNILISPYSVMQALAMTANGANGQTKSEMEQTLGGMEMDQLNKYLYTQRVSQPDTEACKLSTANSIWYRDNENMLNVKPEFLQKNADYYGADAFSAPFDGSTVKDINNWVKEKTDDMIPEIIREIDGSTMLYLINAIAFDAKWENPYDSEYHVNKADFVAWDGTVQQADMLYSVNEYDYLEDEQATGFYKAYQGGKYAFAAILPDEGISLDEYISGLTAESLQEMLSNPTHVETHTAMPKFSYDYSIDLESILPEMGMPTAFSSMADFSATADTAYGSLYISKVLHKTHIDVTEEGTRAAAVTAVMENCTSVITPPAYKTVTLDRPFIYMIVDMENHLPVFMGALQSVES